MLKKQCKCGNKVEELFSYFDKQSGYRITCCEECARTNNLNDESKYEKISHSKIKSEQVVFNDDKIVVKTTINEELNKTPTPNAN